MRSLSRVSIVLLLCCMVMAQQKETPKFTARTELVTVPVVVTRAGHFVGGLARTDFNIQEDGQPKAVAFFEQVQAEPVKLRTAELAPGEYTNALTEPNKAVPLTVIVLDRVFTPVPEYNNAIHELVNFVRQHVHVGEPIMLAEVNNSGLKILQDFTTSPEELIAALTGAPRGLMLQRPVGTVSPKNDDGKESAKGYEGDSIREPIDVAKSNPDPDAPKDSAFDQTLHDAKKLRDNNRAAASMRAMEQIARGLAGIPGRKTLLWTSPGYLCPTKGFMKDAKGKTVAAADQCEVIWRLLNAGNIAVYPVIPTQTENPTFSSGRCVGPCGGSHPVMQQLIILSYAQYTGGKVCSYRNDLDTCYQRAVEDSAQYYMLSYYTTPTATPAWRRIRVTVNVPSTNVRARNWYLTAGAADTIEAQYTSDVATAIVSPVEYTGIPMIVRWTEAKQESGKKKFGFEIRVRPGALTVDASEDNHMKLHVVAVAMDAAGTWTADMTQKVNAHLKESNLAELRATGLVYRNLIEIAPVTSRVKFVERESLFTYALCGVAAGAPRSRPSVLRSSSTSGQ